MQLILKVLGRSISGSSFGIKGLIFRVSNFELRVRIQGVGFRGEWVEGTKVPLEAGVQVWFYGVTGSSDLTHYKCGFRGQGLGGLG